MAKLKARVKHLSTGLWRARTVGLGSRSGKHLDHMPSMAARDTRGSAHRKAAAAFHRRERATPKKAKTYRNYLRNWGKK